MHLYLDDPDAYAVGSALEGALDDAGPASSIEGVWAAGFKLLREEEAFGHADEAAASSSSNTTFLSRGDRILLPHGALVGFLDALYKRKGTRQPPTPICVRLTIGGVSRVCGIADWSAPEGAVIVPQWLLDQMTPSMEHVPTAGDFVRVESTDVPRATALTLRPLGQSIRELSHERQLELLTRGVQHVFTNVRVGDHVRIDGEGGGTFEVLACRGKHDDGVESPARRQRPSAAAETSAAGGGDERRDEHCDERGGVPREAVCVVAQDNAVLEFDLSLEESLERENARAAFDAAREAYRAVLAAAEGDARLLIEDASAREALRALVRAADAAAQAGCEFGEELETARHGLRAAEELAARERMAREAQAQAEAAREAEATRLATEAIAAKEAAETARVEAVRVASELQASFQALVPQEPGEGGAPIRVQWPHGGGTQRRFEPAATLEQVRAWVVTVYPADAPTSLSQRFVLKTRPVPGTPTLILDQDNQHLTVEQAGLRGQTLIFDDL